MEAPFGIINPNSQNQMWSRWNFGVQADLNKMPSLRECEANAKIYFRKLFGSVGRGRVLRHGNYYAFQVEVEKGGAHDPDYQTAVKKDFIGNFMFKGFGYSARLIRFKVRILAGNKEDGKPSDQLLVIPRIQLLP